ncbi:Rad9/DDC1 [Penicillium angulare]|uniref:Rad9/DDC1 n=1 Tax=Penicillium angulare TaxID=116970 RepID=UPI002540AC34|nr:Rad9/DDC1 [Penicillium angulare]KAJ5273117.1 Rad9/DDC1 [Penicillium angulare]
MTSLKLSLAPPALVRLHDALTCLAKFSDTVAIEAEHDLLRLSALNSTKTAFASFGEQAVFTSFTTKITEGKEILKHPVHTSVAADKRDFEEYLVEDNMHVAINLKDFKAVVSHAETANATVTARYTRPCKPLQLAYEFEGVSAEFTIMTRGETENEEAPSSSRATIPQLSRRTQAAPTPTPAPVPISVRSESFRATQNSQMPPPPSRSRSIRPLNGSSTQQHLSQTPVVEKMEQKQEQEQEQGLTGSASIEFDSLFVPQDDDRQWDEMNDEEEPQDILGWDATGGQDTFEGSLRDAEPDFPKTTISHKPPQDDMGIPPTQRMSQVRGLGLFD